jgi:hypothetical protein
MPWSSRGGGGGWGPVIGSKDLHATACLCGKDGTLLPFIHWLG